MELGFDTIGNATLIAYDREPVLVTDPWFEGDAYFGSWTLSHDIPDEQREAIERAKFVWISHGHPDHLSMRSLQRLSAATLLLPDHVGGRIAAALRADGFTVSVLPDRQWVPLSDRIRVCSIADYNQDAILLVDVGGRLVLDINDAFERGWRRFVRDTTRRYDVSFLLRLSGFGDADMINLFDEDGRRIPPRAARREPPGRALADRARQLGARYVVPFSSMHRYQRADSVWANEYVTDLDDHALGFESRTSELLPAFLRYDCLTDTATPIEPPRRPIVAHDPAEYGDDWDEPLEPDDVSALESYVGRVTHLARHFDFVSFRVGGGTHTITLRGRGGGARRRGLTFEVPRGSLMTAVRHDIFDDVLIGNFARVTVHGTTSNEALYPDFTPYVAKYGDNGGAYSGDELRAYFRAYRERAPFDYVRHQLEWRSVDRVRRLLPRESPLYEATRRTYQLLTASRR
jgi:hypothetical protein